MKKGSSARAGGIEAEARDPQSNGVFGMDSKGHPVQKILADLALKLIEVTIPPTSAGAHEARIPTSYSGAVAYAVSGSPKVTVGLSPATVDSQSVACEMMTLTWIRWRSRLVLRMSRGSW